MNTGQQEERIPTVADVEAAIRVCDIALQTYEEEAGQGDDAAPLKLANATRERQRLVDSLQVARAHEAAMARVAANKGKKEAAEKVVVLRAKLAERRLPASEMAAEIAGIRLDLEAKEEAFRRYLLEDEPLFREINRLDAIAKGTTPSGDVSAMHSTEVRRSCLIEIERRRLAPHARITDEGRFFGPDFVSATKSPLYRAPKSAPVTVAAPTPAPTTPEE
jgi:hypothetical protein